MTPADSGTTKSLHPHRRRQPLFPGTPPGEDPGSDRPDPPPSGSEPEDQASPAIGPAVAAGPEPPLETEPEPEPGHDARNETRSTLRAARRRRRRSSIGWAVLIAVCTALTLLIVAAARDRAPGPQVLTPAAPFAASPPVDHQAVPQFHSIETLGASAPQGGHR
jgi:hypothetical protein